MTKVKIGMDKVAGEIADWIAARVREAGLAGIAVGLSGGVDSAVTMALSKKALGKNVVGVIMPCESDSRDEQDARMGKPHTREWIRSSGASGRGGKRYEWER